MTPRALSVRVARKHIEAVDICSFELVSADGGALPAFAAGSHIDVGLSNGLTRQYSLCNDPTENHRYVIGVLKDPASRGGSRAMHEQVHEGNLLLISPPKNHFPLCDGVRRARAPRHVPDATRAGRQRLLRSFFCTAKCMISLTF